MEYKNNWTLIHGDNISVINDLKQKNVRPHIIITSPPYNVDLGNNKYKKDGYKEYNDNMPYNLYLEWMQNVFIACYDILTDDGRICINIGDGKNGQIPTHADFITLLKKANFKFKTTILWKKNNTSNRTAWGSYLSPSSPSFPRDFEYILIAQKTDKLTRPKGEITITKDEWKEYTNGIWTFAPERNQKKIGHPAMFPIELPSRLIKMLTYKGDLVLDPFCGVGTTNIASLLLGRDSIGIDIDKTYINIAKDRITKLFESEN